MKMLKKKLAIGGMLASTGFCLIMFQNCSQTVPFSQTDFGQNKSSSDSTSTVVCGGVGSSSDCNAATSPIKGEIYYMNAAEQDQYGTIGVDTYFDHGTKVDATVLLDQVFIPTTSFSQGFPASTSGTTSYLKDGDGNLLVEYFAMKLKTNLQLTADQGPGLYQLALISDDGARILRTDTGEEVVDGDGTHSSMFSCGSTISLAAGQSIPLEIDYYQGPRYEIALTFMWRKVSSSAAASLSDPLCNQSGNDTFFGPQMDDFSTNYGYGQLLSRGWSVVSKDNMTAASN